MVATPDSSIVFDLAGGCFGRGAWVHPRSECVAKSVRGLGPALRAPVATSTSELHHCLVAAAWRRAEGLGRAAKRSGHLIIGGDAGAIVWKSGKVAAVIVAEDARAAALASWVSEAKESGRAIVGPSKSTLGCWWGQEQVAVAAVTDSGLARALVRAIAIAHIPDPSVHSWKTNVVRRLDEQ